MTQTISRMYATAEQAQNAFAELKRRHYQDVHLFAAPVVVRSGDGEAESGTTVTHQTSAEDLVAEMMRAFILKSDAKIYAEQVRQGGHLVTVHAPFSGGHTATWVLEKNGPIDSGVSEPSYPSYPWDSSAPLSSAFKLPVLTKTKLPFEALTNLPSITRAGGLFSCCLGLPMLSHARTFTGGLLSRQPTPLSSAVGLPLLTKP